MTSSLWYWTSLCCPSCLHWLAPNTWQYNRAVINLGTGSILSMYDNYIYTQPSEKTTMEVSKAHSAYVRRRGRTLIWWTGSFLPRIQIIILFTPEMSSSYFLLSIHAVSRKCRRNLSEFFWVILLTSTIYYLLGVLSVYMNLSVCMTSVR